MPLPSLTGRQRPLQPAVRRLAFTCFAVLLSAALPLPPLQAASPLLESVKQNPQLAKRLCDDLRQLNGRGVTSKSPEAIAMVAKSQGLNSTDAEILTTYVVGLHCPDVR
ncbi:hypothetical protein [Synechococcus sp. CS-205]|uniref:hypothetical protein n=1 Tax=Synechococcus sp. CS-205 TaxID=2847984 RepID=UPI00287FFB10|nr:hypothetical protein [Synechococcus sp. CS-205]